MNSPANLVPHMFDGVVVRGERRPRCHDSDVVGSKKGAGCQSTMSWGVILLEDEVLPMLLEEGKHML